jgi:hypothetical protein
MKKIILLAFVLTAAVVLLVFVINRIGIESKISMLEEIARNEGVRVLYVSDAEMAVVAVEFYKRGEKPVGLYRVSEKAMP